MVLWEANSVSDENLITKKKMEDLVFVFDKNNTMYIVVPKEEMFMESEIKVTNKFRLQES